MRFLYFVYFRCVANRSFTRSILSSRFLLLYISHRDAILPSETAIDSPIGRSYSQGLVWINERQAIVPPEAWIAHDRACPPSLPSLRRISIVLRAARIPAAVRITLRTYDYIYIYTYTIRYTSLYLRVTQIIFVILYGQLSRRARLRA